MMVDLGFLHPSGITSPSTCGCFAFEADAEEYVASMLQRSGLFLVYRQVRGRPLAHHHFQRTGDLRADVLLVPDKPLIRLGWSGGAIVIEVKRSGEKLGPGLNQLLDYMNAAWLIGGGVPVVPSFGFLFPAPQQHGPLASIMAHQHIGTAWFEDDELKLYAGESKVMSVRGNGEVDLGSTDFGRKLGAR
jgi:hypothetical protein